LCHYSLINLFVLKQLSDGDLGATGKARECYMKQKHRLIWERRHGKVGSGMKEAKTAVAEEE
jgi:hypothetical protein